MTTRAAKSTQNELILFGKVPPHAQQLEEAVLGALMLDSTAYGAIEDTLTPDCFYGTDNRQIFEAVASLASKSLPVDILTVTEELSKRGANVQPYYVVELTNRVASAANLEYHSMILKQKAIQRKQIDVCQAGLRDAYNDTVDPLEALDKLEKSVFGIANGAVSKKEQSIGHFAIEALKRADKAMSQKGLTGVPCGLHTVDRQTGGWQPTDLIILAARPGMGKTSFAMQCAIHAASIGMPAIFFSLEMSGEQLAQRAMSQKINRNVQSLRTGKLTERDFQDLQTAAQWFQDMPLYIDDTAAISLSQLRSKARKLVMSKGIKLIVIDYIQLMTTTVEKGATRERYLSDISAGIKALAKELNVSIIALSQLSRAVESRSDKRPQLSDLRESGSLEQDADAVVFLYRPEYYGVTADEAGASTAGQCEVIFAKHRNGAVGTCDENVGFQGDCTRFFNLNETQYMVKSDSEPSFEISKNRPSVTDDIPF